MSLEQYKCADIECRTEFVFSLAEDTKPWFAIDGSAWSILRK